MAVLHRRSEGMNGRSVIRLSSLMKKNRIALCSMIKFEHSVFALPFALTGTAGGARFRTAGLRFGRLCGS